MDLGGAISVGTIEAIDDDIWLSKGDHSERELEQPKFTTQRELPQGL